MPKDEVVEYLKLILKEIREYITDETITALETAIKLIEEMEDQ